MKKIVTMYDAASKQPMRAHEACCRLQLVGLECQHIKVQLESHFLSIFFQGLDPKLRFWVRVGRSCCRDGRQVSDVVPMTCALEVHRA